MGMFGSRGGIKKTSCGNTSNKTETGKAKVTTTHLKRKK